MSFIKDRNAWIIPLIAAAIIAFMGLWSRGRVGAELRSGLSDELKTIVHANSTAVEIWLENQKRLVSLLATDPEVQDCINLVLDEYDANPTLDIADLIQFPSPSLLVGQIEFSRVVGNRMLVLRYPDAFLMSSNGFVIAESAQQKKWLGVRFFQEEAHPYRQALAQGQPVILTYEHSGFPSFPKKASIPGESLTFPEVSMHVLVPIFDHQGQARALLGVVLDSAREFSRILSVARKGLSGESYAFDSHGRMLSSSRFDALMQGLGLIRDAGQNLVLHDPGKPLSQASDVPADLSQRPLTYFVEQATVGQENGIQIEGVRDYRGVQVVGGWKWFPQYQFGIVSQIDQEEACRSLQVLSLVFICLFLTMILFALGLGWVSWFHMTSGRRLDLLQLNARQLGNYTLQEKIGQGGMGVVYRACHALLRRETAIKLLSPEVANGLEIARFEKEVQLTCRLTHPNTVQVYDYGHTPDGIFYYAMEYLPGINLQDMVVDFGPQSDAHVIYILTAVCESLHEAHSLGLIHRDIKPPNILVCERGGLPEVVKVLDFGLAREFKPGMHLSISGKKSHSPTGTPNFMSPESIINADHVNHLSDIYAIGALGIYLLTGEYLFPHAETSEAICQAQMTEIPANASSRLNRPVCPVLESTLMLCLAKNPLERWQSIWDVFSNLQRSPEASRWGITQRAEWWANAHGDSSHSTPAAMDEPESLPTEHFAVS